MTETTANLGGVLKRGAAMSAVGLVIAQAATIVQTIVLGRILGPTEVGIFMHDDRVIATEFEDALAQARCDGLRDMPAHLRRAGE